MGANNFIDRDLFNHLDYGKLYMFVSSSHQAEAYSKLLQESAHKYADWEKIAKMQLVTVQVPEVNRLGMVIAARKINAGNIGRYAVLACVIKDASALDEGLVSFCKKLVAVDNDPDYYGEDNSFTLLVPEPSVEDCLSFESKDCLSSESKNTDASTLDDVIAHNLLPPRTKVREPHADAGKEPQLAPSILKEAKLQLQRSRTVCKSISTHHIWSEEEEIEFKIRQSEQREQYDAERLKRQRDHDLQLIQALVIDFIQKYHTDPTELIATTLQGKYIVNTMPMVVVNRDRKIVFPEYNEMELKLSAASRTLYIWFLRHPEGCKLNELRKHCREITDIYLEVHPGCNYLTEAVEALLEASKLNQNLSRIKKMVRGIIINDDIARHYFISGTRGGTYTLPIAADTTKVRVPQEK